MQRTKPPFRADHVGSLLRTAPLKEARAKRDRGEIKAEALRQIADHESESSVVRQRQCELKAVTYGEFRRSCWHFDFYSGLACVELYATGAGIKFAGVETKAEGLRIVDKLDFTGHPMLAHFGFLKEQ